MTGSRVSGAVRVVFDRKWGLVAVVAASAATALLAALAPLPLRVIIDNAVGGEPVSGRVSSFLEATGLPDEGQGLAMVAATAFGVLGALLALSGALVGYLWAAVGNGIVERVAVQIYDRSISASADFHARTTGADQMVRISTDSWAVYAVANLIFGLPSTELLTMCTVAVAAWQIESGLTLVLFTVVPPVVVVARIASLRLTQRSRAEAESQAELAGVVRDTARGLPDILHLGANDRHDSLFTESGLRWRQHSIRTVSFNVLAETATLVLTQAARATVLLIGGLAVLDGSTTVGTLVVFLGYSEVIIAQVRRAAAAHRQWSWSKASVDRINEVLWAQQRVDVSTRQGDPVSLSSGALKVVFDEVSFSYGESQVLDRVSLRAAPGTVTALVGPTGAGKSTLVSLLPRLIDPTSGTITIGGVDHRHIPIATLRGSIGVVRQDPHLFPVSVADNIAYGRPSASRAEIVMAATAANADEFIDDLPDGYDTVIGDGGIGLSGGQRQRLAIARALLKDAPILVLDEPTSALDAETEAEVMDAVDRLMQDRTVFVIAHRLSTVRSADQIVVLDHGRIVERGTRHELLTRNGLYHTLHTLQFRDTAPGDIGE